MSYGKCRSKSYIVTALFKYFQDLDENNPEYKKHKTEIYKILVNNQPSVYDIKYIDILKIIKQRIIYLYNNDHEMKEDTYNLISKIESYLLNEKIYDPIIPVFDENIVLDDFDKFKFWLQRDSHRYPEHIKNIMKILKNAGILSYLNIAIYDIKNLFNSDTINGLFLKIYIYQNGLGVEKNTELVNEYYTKIYAKPQYKNLNSSTKFSLSSLPLIHQAQILQNE